MMDGTEHMVGVYLLIAAGLVVAVFVSVALAALATYLFGGATKGRRGLP